MAFPGIVSDRLGLRQAGRQKCGQRSARCRRNDIHALFSGWRLWLRYLTAAGRSRTSMRSLVTSGNFVRKPKASGGLSYDPTAFTVREKASQFSHFLPTHLILRSQSDRSRCLGWRACPNSMSRTKSALTQSAALARIFPLRFQSLDETASINSIGAGWRYRYRHTARTACHPPRRPSWHRPPRFAWRWLYTWKKWREAAFWRVRRSRGWLQ